MAEVGFSWGDLVDAAVASHGSLAAAAEHLAEQRGFAEDVESVERGLRRLRAKRRGDGGVWGRRALRGFGLPAAVTDRVRWMGQYHTRFTDLPASICAELLRPWLRPPVSESPARIWVALGQANLALRRREDPSAPLERAAQVAERAEPAARVELALVQAYALDRADPEAARAGIEAAGALLDQVEGDDHACLFARWIDQRAYRLNKPRAGRPDHAAAAAMYRQIPAGGPLFAQCRRANGLGWSLFKLGDVAAAEACARASVRAAGDAGSLRMRAMALNLLAKVLDDASVRARAQAIARRLEDEALTLRFAR